MSDLDQALSEVSSNGAEIGERPSLLVLGHGTRDADGVEEFWQLAQMIRDAAGSIPTEFGFIELAEPTVDEAIDRLLASGDQGQSVVSVPLVLLAAGHLKNDGPAALARARQRHPKASFRLARDLGIHPLVLDVVEERIRVALAESDPAQSGVVLVGRGSSDPDAGADLYKLARLLSDGRGLPTIEPAFVQVAQPDVRGALERARKLGARTIVLAPLLLFTGRLLPRIYREAAEWAEEYPEIEIRGGAHLGPDRRLAKLAIERYREAIVGDVRMNCDMCVYRVRLPGYEEKTGMPISLTPHGDAPSRGRRRARRATRAPEPPPPLELAPRKPGLRPAWTAVPEEGPPALEVRDLSFAYPSGQPVLANINLRLNRGERVAIVGPNGAGKTTLIMQLNGMLDASSGEVHVAGMQLTPKTRKQVRAMVGLVFQDPDDQLFMPTVASDVAFGPANQGLKDAELRERVSEALEAVRLTDEAERAPHELSAGQRRRAAVAGIIAMRPELLILDEPTSHLDPAARRELVDVLQSLKVTVLLVTHDLPYALELCPRTIVLDSGVISADGATREILADEGFMTAHRLELPAGFNPLGA